ncbi:MAG: MFS transporter [Candidatus Hydrogenedentes bacterium]|nr:MFS transporter [Candidatus Hydrogenedentota bacterium]
MSSKRQLLTFCIAVMAMAAAMGVHESLFNNFLSDTYALGADARGRLEFPRELPGFLVVLRSGLLCTLAVTRVGAVAALAFGVGMAGMAFWGASSYGIMLTMMLVGSAGLHLMQPVGSSIAIALSDHGNRGARMGQVGAVGTAGTVLGTGSVWLLMDKTHPQYALGFLCAGALGLAAAALYFTLHVPDLHQARSRLVLRRQYSLYYLLEFLFGARKQIFITFGPWVLIKVYGEAPSGIARLLMTGAIIGVVFAPLAGKVIDRFGERVVMIADGMLLTFVCIGYGYANHLVGDKATAHTIACCCFVADNLLFALGTSRAVYLSRLTDSAQEINSTLAMGVSINHIASMTIPAVAGAVWMRLGYERVFAAAAVLAVLNALVATRVPSKRLGR